MRNTKPSCGRWLFACTLQTFFTDVPVLVCDQGIGQLDIDPEVASADAKRWWRTGLLPLRASPNRPKSPDRLAAQLAADQYHRVEAIRREEEDRKERENEKHRRDEELARKKADDQLPSEKTAETQTPRSVPSIAEPRNDLEDLDLILARMLKSHLQRLGESIPESQTRDILLSARQK